MSTSQWVIETINTMVEMGGEKVAPNNYLERLAVCNECPRKGQVTPLPFITVDGCLECGCPFATKPRFKKHFSFKRLAVIKTECPLKKWEKVDNKFL